jgi:LmbE family N-acetylglucosaminyl deacetylase
VPHVFISPHPDDAALSCGGLIASLRARGEPVAILTVFSGAGPLAQLTPYQREALGFGANPGRRSRVRRMLARKSIADAEAPGAAPTPERAMAVRRAEDESFARFSGASISFLNLPDAVFRGYEGDAQLMGRPRADDRPPVDELRGALAELRPGRLYVPLSIGGHVDHRQARRAAVALLAGPGSPYLDRASFYEDFPYAHKVGFERLDQLDPEILPSLPAGVTLAPEYVEIGAVIDRKLQGLRVYESQLGHLFGGGRDPLSAAVRERAARLGVLGGAGPAERYWRVTTT